MTQKLLLIGSQRVRQLLVAGVVCAFFGVTYFTLTPVGTVRLRYRAENIPYTLAERSRCPRSFRHGNEILFSDPIKINRGGVYRGNWFSPDPETPAIYIKTTEPVVIEKSVVAGYGDLVRGKTTSLTIRETEGFGVSDLPGKFVDVWTEGTIDISRTYFENLWGIKIHGKGPGVESGSFRVAENCGMNIREGIEKTAHFVQIADGVFYSSRIENNVSVNLPRSSKVEDVINLYNARGAASSPIYVRSNLIDGAYPGDPTHDNFSGGGIIVDGDKNVNAESASAFVAIEDNCILSTANYGVAIASGNNNLIFRNITVSSGLLRDGSSILSQNVGIYIWNSNEGPAFFSNVAKQNFSFWRQAASAVSGRGVKLNNYWLPDCQKKQDGASLCEANSSPSMSLDDTEALRFENQFRKGLRDCLGMSTGTSASLDAR